MKELGIEARHLYGSAKTVMVLEKKVDKRGNNFNKEKGKVFLWRRRRVEAKEKEENQMSL